MNDFFRNICSGMGNTISILPNNDYGNIINPRGSAENAFSHNWERVGQHLDFAIQKGMNESGITKFAK